MAYTNTQLFRLIKLYYTYLSLFQAKQKFDIYEALKFPDKLFRINLFTLLTTILYVVHEHRR